MKEERLRARVANWGHRSAPGEAGQDVRWEPLRPGLRSDSPPATSVVPPPPSHDQRFFLKTQGRREVRALLAHLPRYVQHLQRHPHSLLARLLGTHLGLRGEGEGLRRRPGSGAVPGWGAQGT